MPAYHYLAINPEGLEHKGVIEADSEKQARQLLRDKSFVPVSLRAALQKKELGKVSLFSRKRGLSSKDLALVTRQFATLLSAGLPLEEALMAVAEQSEKQHLKGLLFSVRSKVVEGHSLAAALREHPEAFSHLYAATIAAGEKTGHLDKVLLRLADYTEKQWQIQQKLRTALIYPSMIILVAVSIVGFLLEYVVPKMVAVYSQQKQALPAMTDILISISNFIKAYGFIMAVLLAGIFFSLRYLIKKSVVWQEKWHYCLLRLPLVRHLIKTSNTARFSRTLSILSAAGVPILEAMGIAAQLIGIIPIRKAIDKAVNHVREGATIHLSLKQTTYFSPMSVHMIASGEVSGQLEGMLDRVAQTQEEEIASLIDTGLALFEPAIILVMGAVVLFIVLAVLLPIFNMNDFAG